MLSWTRVGKLDSELMPEKSPLERDLMQFVQINVCNARRRGCRSASAQRHAGGLRASSRTGWTLVQPLMQQLEYPAAYATLTAVVVS